MIRPLDWRDLSLLRRVRDEGLCLDSQLRFTRGPRAMQQGLLDVLLARRNITTLVARSAEAGEGPALGRITHRADETYARLAFVCPGDALTKSIGMQLLDALGQAAGERSAYHLIGEVDEGDPVFESMRRAGFAIYARQRIWVLERSRMDEVEPPAGAWRPAVVGDQAAIHNLYLDLVPGMVQQVEPPPSNGHCLVHRADGEVLGFLEINRGPRGTWVQPYLHPAADNIQALLASFLFHQRGHYNEPVYFCVRSYQGSMNNLLHELGFAPLSQQAVMVKHIAAHVRKPLLAPLRSMEGTSPEPTAPFATSKEGWTSTRVR